MTENSRERCLVLQYFEKFGCDEVMSQNPSYPEDQESLDLTTPEEEAVQAQIKNHHAQSLERKKILQEME
ncbi:hypothetical protein N7517_006661 [Penicillium concentricum]|uniref:Uncharacterized protein n=1 Tax=Penicillium concentricum TaxID=293559 RepID=A0A9W9SAX7_9EURO|nr:uncharacterized protein N7517_006661 [Penicillium concentricum]KAJ5374655.1 hypothetical protein N7517_006661 [Penicillium concentricum]